MSSQIQKQTMDIKDPLIIDGIEYSSRLLVGTETKTFESGTAISAAPKSAAASSAEKRRASTGSDSARTCGAPFFRAAAPVEFLEL